MDRRWHGQFVVGALVTALFALGFYGCAVQKKSVEPEKTVVSTAAAQETAASREYRRITGIQVGGDESEASVLIQGSEDLMYTAVPSPFENGVVFYFPDTGLAPGVSAGHYPEKSVVEQVITSESKGRHPSSRIEIRLKRDVPYEIERDGPTLYVFLGRGQPYVEPDQAMVQEEEEPADQWDDVTARQDSYVDQQEEDEYVAEPQVEEAVVSDSVASMPAAQVVTEPEAWSEPAEPAIEPEPLLAGPVWLNRVDFLQKPAGRSSIRVQLTHPVKYRMTKAGEKRLVLEFPGVVIPKEQQRPLITTRFESAADRIVPYARNATDAAVSIELREMVAYHVEQTDQGVLIHFEASDVPPRPMAQAALPRWETIMRTEEPLITPKEARALADQEEMAPEYAGFEDEGRVDRLTGFMDAIADDLRGGTDKKVKYTGEKIALDFYKTDIKNVFRILKEVSGINFAIDRDVEGEVTLTLEKPVPWDQVLHLVLKMNQLGMTRMNDIIRIAPQSVLDEEAAAVQARVDAEKDKIQSEADAALARKEAEDAARAVEPLVTEFISVNYATASDMKSHLEDIKTEERGKVNVDERTNTIIMTDTKDKLERARKIVQRLDRVTAQVQIEARVVEAQTSFSRNIGIGWGMDSGIQPGDSRSGIGPQRGYDVLGGTYGYNFAVNYPVAMPTTGANAFTFNFARILGLTPLTLNATLNALESQGELRIVSSPKVRTLDNKKATIKQGLDYPIRTFDGDGNTTIEYKKVDLLLEVTPHVTQDRRIAMKIMTTKNDIGAEISGERSFNTKETETELLVNDGETVVIGGIIKTTVRDVNTGWPGLTRVPVLGWLFKDNEKVNDREELLIFITPTIVELEETVNF